MSVNEIVNFINFHSGQIDKLLFILEINSYKFTVIYSYVNGSVYTVRNISIIKMFISYQISNSALLRSIVFSRIHMFIYRGRREEIQPYGSQLSGGQSEQGLPYLNTSIHQSSMHAMLLPCIINHN